MQSVSKRAASLATAVAILLIAAVGAAQAAPLNVGTPQLPVDQVTAPTVAGGASIVAGGVAVPFTSFGLTYSGTLTSTVWEDDPGNPYLGSNPDAKTFTYTLTNNSSTGIPPSTNVLHRLTVGSYGGTPTILTDVGYDNSTTGVSPTVADRSTADVIGFTFADLVTGIPQLLGNIPPGSGSKTLVVRTNSTAFAPSFASVIDGSVTVVASWAPVQQIPEPSTLVLAGMGIVGLAVGIARRRR
jgi:hypothetical protein